MKKKTGDTPSADLKLKEKFSSKIGDDVFFSLNQRFV